MSRVSSPSVGQQPQQYQQHQQHQQGSTGTSQVSHDKIAMRAYEKWCQRGRPQGTQVQDWLEAERELQAEALRNLSQQGQRR
jgi:hypothetical protein